MIAKRADLLPVWELGKARGNQYRANSVVYYQKDPDEAGYAYRGKNPYTETFKEPDINKENWEIDKSYAVPWKASGKYEQGSRVYYFNGSMAYVYIPTIRYFGGTNPPNQEVDDDGIRTWELETNYRYGPLPNYFGINRSPLCEVLIPVRKYGGYTGQKVGGMSPIFPEDRFFDAYYEDYDTGAIYSIYGNILYYLEEEGKQSKDFKEINSVWQSYAYDTDTYVFYENNFDSNGKPIHRKKGPHRAKVLKELNYQSWNDYYKYAESQFEHTRVNSFWFESYVIAHGFSIEMWPNISDSEYELVPTSGLKTRGNYFFSTPLTPLTPIPSWGAGVSWGGGVYRDWYYGSLGFSGDMRDPNGDGFDGNYGRFYDITFKRDGFFWRSSPAFSNRDSVEYMLKTDELVTYEAYPRYKSVYNPVTGITDYVRDGNNYMAKTSKPVYSVIAESFDSRESSYEQPPPRNLQSLTKTAELNNQLDFGRYAKRLTYTSIQKCGWKID